MALPKYFKIEDNGETVLLPVHVCNDNETSIKNVTVTFDAFPAGITVGTFVKEVGTYSTLTRVWTIPTLPGLTSTEACVHGYLPITVTDKTLLPIDITATIVNAEDGDIPGENETSLIYNIDIHDLTDIASLQDKVNISLANTTRDIPEEKGTLYVADTTGGNAIFTLPPLNNLQTGDIYRFLFETAGGNTLTIKGNGTEEIDGSNTYLMTEGEYLELAAFTTNPVRWLKLSN